MRDASPLPVRVEPAPGESGLGYLLRAARANGMSLPGLLEALELPKSPRPTPQGLAALAQATEVDYAWLLSTTVVASRRDGYCCAEWRDRLWTCSLSLRGAYPQVCTECLREGRPCMLEWEMTGFVACLRHRRPLTDACMHCGRRLSWWRPSIDVCACGHFLASDRDLPPVSDDVLGWTAKLVSVANGASSPVSTTMLGLPRWIDAFSADGLLAATFAFGVRREPFERVASATATAPPSTLRAAEILERGIARIRRSDDLRGRCPSDLKMRLYEEGLQRLWRRGAQQADRLAAAGLLRWLGAAPRRSRSGTGVREGQQRELFELEAGNE